ncbi:unannotated protein [freshwater metagenome]|uniref:Unannotated protein n=1 Tax=freshwater metagenome TaxID=449393 RepID=A0A6J7EJJ8_9ZZZZ|nr:alpha/beta fold hydrolase [Actinomycetota bacterium]
MSGQGRSGWVPQRPSAAQFQRWGVDPGWSQLVTVPGSDGVARTWHVLDRTPPAPVATIVCVHGNPTWSYHWRSFHERLGDRYRVIAVDQLGMGFSERTERRRFADRVTDLGDVLRALQVEGPVITAAYDWGGPISLGWALAAGDQLAGVVLCNTGVAVPAGRRAPALIRLAAAGPMTDLVGHRTRIFVDGTLMLSGQRVAPVAREGYRAPYRHARDRHAIAEFVADVPFTPKHPSAAAIEAVAEGLRSLRVPTLLAWGARDPVFNDDFALDLGERVPHADRHRYAGMGHLVVEETDVAGLVDAWLAERVIPHRAPAPDPVVPVVPAAPPVWAALDARRADTATAFVDGATGTSTSFVDLHNRVLGIAGGLAQLGVQPGDRVGVLVPPSVDLLATVYACWRAGAVTVIADRGLGLRGLGAAVRAADVSWVIGPPKAIAAARLLRWAPGATAIAVGARSVLGAACTLDQLAASGAPAPTPPGPDDPAAVLYTSGATGPAKGVRYRHAQMSAQRDVLAQTYGITSTDRLVAAFAPFALYGPALGIASTIPDVDVAAPGTLTAAALGAAVGSVEATIVFASPAALANVNRTAHGPQPQLANLRLVLSAGAPVPIATLRATAALCPSAELHTPYGMTECLPVADIDLAGIDTAGDGDGVCVGAPVPGVAVMIAPLGFDADRVVVGVADALVGPVLAGEVLVRAPWVSEGYNQLWRTEHDARPRTADGRVWHRTGDVGHLDTQGRLWIEGRSVHVIHADAGAITPVPVEVAVEGLEGISKAAAVGVGPLGCQQLVVVVEHAQRNAGLADDVLAERVRSVVKHPVAAVATVRALPVDIRHNTKIDRTAVAVWATALLAGDRARVTW